MSWLYSPLLPSTQLLAQTSPSVALNSPADTGTTSDTTPTLDFTGTDAEGDDVRYQVQIDTVNTFDSQGTTWRALSLNDNGVLYDDPSEATNTDNISFFAWIKLDALNRDHTIWMNGHGGSFGQGYQFYVKDTNVLSIDVAYVAGLDSALEITDTDWHFVGFVRNSGTWTVYLDDQSEVVGTNSPFSIGSESLEVVGGWVNDGVATAQFEGRIAQLGYWEAVLDSTNIANLLAGDTPDTISTGLVVHLALNDDTAWGTNPGSDGDFTTSGTLTEVDGPTFGVGALIDVVSGTDSGFANPDNGGDTDPFNSGENIQYTVQSALSVDTYYWRVRAIDPSGSNTYGSWSSTRSFDITAGDTTTPQTITGKARIEKATTQTVTGKGRIEKSTSQTITGLARIQKVASQTIQGLARITVTTTRTLTGLARLEKSASQTITGKARVEKSASQTTTAVARITGTTTQTITGKARIEKIITQTIAGVARLEKSASQTITGIARIVLTTPQTIQGLARITATTTRTILGVARIQGTASQTVNGKARLEKSAIQSVNGVARVQKSQSQTTIGKARITATSSQNTTAVARIEALFTKNIIGLSRIEKSQTKNVTGVANLGIEAVKTILGKAFINVIGTQTITGKAKIKRAPWYAGSPVDWYSRLTNSWMNAVDSVWQTPNTIGWYLAHPTDWYENQ